MLIAVPCTHHNTYKRWGGGGGVLFNKMSRNFLPEGYNLILLYATASFLFEVYEISLSEVFRKTVSEQQAVLFEVYEISLSEEFRNTVSGQQAVLLGVYEISVKYSGKKKMFQNIMLLTTVASHSKQTAAIHHAPASCGTRTRHLSGSEIQVKRPCPTASPHPMPNPSANDHQHHQARCLGTFSKRKGFMTSRMKNQIWRMRMCSTRSG